MFHAGWSFSLSICYIWTPSQSFNDLYNCQKYKIYGSWKMGSKVSLALFQWSSSFFLHLQIDFLIHREQNKMTFMKCIIVILAFLVSRVAGTVSSDEDTSSKDRIESVSRNFEKYWITSKGRNKKWWEYGPYYMANLFFQWPHAQNLITSRDGQDGDVAPTEMVALNVLIYHKVTDVKTTTIRKSYSSCTLCFT